MNILDIKKGERYVIADEPLRPDYGGHTYDGVCVAVPDDANVLINDGGRLICEPAARVLCIWEPEFDTPAPEPQTQPAPADSRWWEIPRRQLWEMFIVIVMSLTLLGVGSAIGNALRLIWEAWK